MYLFAIITLVVIYILSCFAAYKFIQRAYYHPEGGQNMFIPKKSDIWCVFLPFLNMFLAFGLLTNAWKTSHEDGDHTSFFEPKKSADDRLQTG